jgi:hypothetical protein
MKLKPSGGCRTFLAAFVATLASVVQMFAQTAQINWNNPADIVYGTALGNAQLNATFTNSDTGAQLQGNVIYTPSAGTFLNAGNQQALKVTFIPNAGQGVPGGLVEKTVFVNVNKAPLTATAPSGTPQYGAGVVAFANGLNANQVTYSGFVNNGAITDNAGNALSVLPTLAVTANATTKAGTSRPVTFAVAPTASNYSVTTVNGTMTVTKKLLVFSLADSNMLYGETPTPNAINIPALTGGPYDLGGGAGTGLGWENNDELNVQVSQVHAVTVSSPVGAYDITVDLNEIIQDILDNYNVQINNGKYNVAQRPLNINVTPGGGSVITYGGALPAFGAQYAIATPGGVTFDIPNVAQNGNALNTAAGVLTAPVVLNIPAANADVANSPHAVTTSGGSTFGGNFAFVRNNDALTVNPAPLTIKASDRTKITAVPLPGIEQLQIEFPNPAQLKFGETPGAIITPFPPPLGYNPQDYLLAQPGDNLSQFIQDGQNGVTLNVGTYNDAIIFDVANLPVAANYAITTQTGDLVVTLQPAQVGWTPQTTTLTYGDAFDAAKHLNAAGTTTIIQNNAPVPLQGVISYTAKLGNNAAIPLVAGQVLPQAGTWIIEATFTPNGGQGVAFGPGTFSINFTVLKKSLKVTANDQTRVFGNHPGPFAANAVTYDGFIQNEGAGDLGTQPAVADPTNAGTSVGDYNIIPSGGVSNNYAFNYVSGKYTITPAATVVTWNPEAAGNDQTKWITYGTALSTTANLNAAGPAGIAGTISYSVNINDRRALTVPGGNVTATFTPSSPNFAESTAVRFLNVVRRNADVVPQGFTMVYGDDMPSITGTSDEANGGFLDADGIVTTFKTDAVKGSNIGEYFITAEYEDTFGRLVNYTIRLSSGDSNRIFVTPATINIATTNKGSAVLQGQATLTLVLSGLKAEAEVLNGVELSAAQIQAAHGANQIVIGNTTYNNVNSGLPASVINLNLLGRVFNAHSFPTFTVPNFSNAVEADFTINTVLDTDPNDGDGLTIANNYVLGTNTSATYSVGKAVPNIVWANSVLTYGQAIGNNELNAVVTDGPLIGNNNPAGTFTYRVGDGNGELASGKILNAGNQTLHVTYVPHPDRQNAFLSATATVTLTVNPAPLDVRVPAINNYVYGDPLPRIQVTELVFGTVQGNNVINNFVNGDDPSIFDPVNGGTQPVVAILPNQNNPQAGFTVGNSPAATTFGQLGAASNYNINHIANVMPIARRPLTVKASDVNTTFGMNVPLTVEYLNLAPGETAENLQSAGFAFLNPQVDIATLVPGNYTVFANGAFGPNYTVTHTTGTLLVGKAIATINVADNIQVFDGAAKPVTVTTTPAGLATIVTYDGGAAVPVSAGSYNVQVTVNDPNWQGTLNTTLVINPAQATIALADMTQTYDGNAKAATITTTPAGIAVSSTYNGNPAAPMNAGTYTLDAAITDPNYAGSAQGVFIIEKANAQIALSKLQQVFDGDAKTIEVQTTPAGLATEVLYDTFATAPSQVGTYTVGVTVVDSNYQGSAEGKLNILSAATITITDLVTTYTGNPQSPTITTNPAGLTVNVTYNKNPTVPHEAGTYEVVATIEDALFSGSAKAKFEIEKANTATISFVAGTLETPWTNVQAPQVTTDPAGLAFQLYYNGSIDLPTETGDYEVKAVIVDRNLTGEATATFTIGKSPQVITFPAIPNLSISGNPVILVLSANSDSGLPVKYTVASGGASVDANLLTITQPGRVVLTAQQLGNEFYLPAEEKVRSFEVSGTGVPLGAAQTEASLNDDGSVNLGVSGSPFQSLSIYSASVVDAEFKPIVKIVLDENGKGSFNTAADADQRFFQVK